MLCLLALTTFAVEANIQKFQQLTANRSASFETFEGELITLHIDDFDHKSASIEHYLRTKDGDLELHFSPKFKFNPKSGQLIKVKATRSGNDLVVTEYSNQNSRNKFLINATKSEAQGTQNLLIVRVKEDADTGFFFAANSIENLFTNNGVSLKAYIDEVSGDRLNLHNTVLDLGSFPNICASSSVVNNMFDMVDEAAKVVTISNYHRIIFVVPRDSDCFSAAGVGSLGKWTVSGTHRASISIVRSYDPAVYTSNYTVAIAAHELGHNLGLDHDNANACGEEALKEDCDVIEYGGSQSIMGLAPNLSHYNAINKEDLGWFDADEILTVGDIISKDQEFTLTPISSSDAGVKMIKFPRAKGGYYVAEYRQPIGFDGIKQYSWASIRQNGILIYINNKNNTRDSILLDKDMIDYRPQLQASGAYYDPYDRSYFDLNLALAFHAKAPFTNDFVDDVNYVAIRPGVRSLSQASLTLNPSDIDLSGGDEDSFDVSLEYRSSIQIGEPTLDPRRITRCKLSVTNTSDYLRASVRVAVPSAYKSLVRVKPGYKSIAAGGSRSIPVNLAPEARVSRLLTKDVDGYYEVSIRLIDGLRGFNITEILRIKGS